MSEEQSRAGGGLVTLYAARLQYRQQARSPHPVVAARSPAPRQFGRRAQVGRRAHAGWRLTRGRGVTMSAIVASALLLGSQGVAVASSLHQVQPGETLGQIAAEYNTTVDQLSQLNQLSNPNLIVAGTTLNVPDDNTPPPSPASDGTAVRVHVVVAGDTLYSIAEQYGMTVDALAQANNLANPNLLVVGTQLKVPAVSATSTQSATIPAGADNVTLHLVSAGETLGSIASYYDVSVTALAGANGISDPNVLEVGDLLQIPGGAPAVEDGATKLRAMPVQHQSLPLSCEAAAVSMATAYWGSQVSEWVFIENLPENENPHLGFRGDITGGFGGTDDYGVYAEPFVPILSNYGFTGDVFYADGDSKMLTDQIDQGRPVVTWVTNLASVETRSYDTVDGQTFALVPEEHAVVVYGYDANGVYVADPGDGSYRQFTWSDFMRSWGYFDGMSLAVYPKS
ncbi:MAG TPA: LysM peptidoglycan-binding domain-containing protein [Nitrolancea sp.]|nr:LysM peptidoglycan-binding domain-containing protein [Nitrolancea sp.]